MLRVCAAAVLCVLAFAATTVRAQDGELVFLHVVFRHGDRSAVFDIPTFDKEGGLWPEGLGQLTELGMLQHFHVGKYMREHYIVKKGLLGPDYHHTQINVRSTDFDRTLQSAASQLAGWFPVNESSVFPGVAWKPIPIHTVPQSQDALLLPYDGDVCPRFQELKAKHKSSPEWAARLATPAGQQACAGVGLSSACTTQDFIAKVGTLAGVTGYSLANIWEVSDTLFCRAQHGFPLPDWASNATAEGNAVFSLLQDLNDWQMFNDFTGLEERRLSGGNTLKQMLATMDKKIANDKSIGDLRVQLYSAHDTTVASILEALATDHYRTRAPPYATCLLVELYRTAPGQYAIQLLLKNQSATDAYMEEPHVLTLPGCTKLCPLTDFKRLVASVIPGDFARECAVQSSSWSTKEKALVGFGVVITVIILIVVCLYMRRRCLKQKSQFMHRDLRQPLSSDTRQAMNSYEDEEIIFGGQISTRRSVSP